MSRSRWVRINYEGNPCFVAIFSKNVISLWINAKNPGNTTNIKYFSCAYQLQCNFVFIGKQGKAISANLFELSLKILLNNLVFFSQSVSQYLKVPRSTQKYPKYPKVPKRTLKSQQVPKSIQKTLKYSKVPKITKSTKKIIKVPKRTQNY